jgi:AcrR family transcriptional regulator
LNRHFPSKEDLIVSYLARPIGPYATAWSTRGPMAGRHLVMLRDGAMAAGCLSDPAAVCETFLNGVGGLVRFRES